MTIELDNLSPGVWSVRSGRGADARVLGVVRKIGNQWYAIRGGKRIGSGGNIRGRAVELLIVACASPVSASTSTSAPAQAPTAEPEAQAEERAS